MPRHASESLGSRDLLGQNQRTQAPSTPAPRIMPNIFELLGRSKNPHEKPNWSAVLLQKTHTHTRTHTGFIVHVSSTGVNLLTGAQE